MWSTLHIIGYIHVQCSKNNNNLALIFERELNYPQTIVIQLTSTFPVRNTAKRLL